MNRKLLLIPFLIPVLFSNSCSRQAHPQQRSPGIFYPAAPETARIQFLAAYSSSEDFTGAAPKFRSFVAGKPDPVLIRKPYGIAARMGGLVIADPGGPGLLLVDFEENTCMPFSPSGPGALRLPVNCALDGEDRIYVADPERRQVVIFDQALQYAGAIGSGPEFRPTDVAIKGDTVYVSDPPSNRICAFDRTSLELLWAFPAGAETGEDAWLYNPVNLSVGGEELYVTDFGHSRIKLFNFGGDYLGSVGSYGRNFGQFVRPKGIATDRENNLFVVDAGFQNVQIFNDAGKLLMFFGGAYQGPGDMYLPAKVLIDYENTDYFTEFVDPAYELEYLILVTNQYGPDKVNVYGRITPK